MTPAIKPTSYQVQVKIFEAAGCKYVRTQGDHLVYHFPGAIRPVVIPRYREVPECDAVMDDQGGIDQRGRNSILFATSSGSAAFAITSDPVCSARWKFGVGGRR